MTLIKDVPYDAGALETLPIDAIELLQESDFGPLFEQIMVDMEHDELSAFDSATAPGGGAWKPLSPATVKRKGHGKILIDSGRMKASVAGRSPDSIRETFDEKLSKGFVFGTSVEYAGFHQEGGEQIPQRRFVGFTEERIQQIQDAVLDHAVALIIGD